jgi:hypothetical protein
MTRLIQSLFFVFFAIAFAGCGDTVTARAIERAQEYCKNKNGIDYIETFHAPIVDPLELHLWYTVHCKNGARVSLENLPTP